MKPAAGFPGGKQDKDRPVSESNRQYCIPLSREVAIPAAAAVLRQAVEKCWSGGPGARLQLGGQARQTAAALAFRRILLQKHIPFNIFTFEPLVACPDMQVSLAGLPCLLVEKSATGRLRKSSRNRLNALLRFPWLTDETIVVFFSLAGGCAKTRNDSQSGNPGNFAAQLPAMWSRPLRRIHLSQLRLRQEHGDAMELTLCGLDRALRFHTQRVQMRPGFGTPAGSDWSSLALICATTRPDVHLRILGPRPSERMILDPGHWQDLRLEGSACIFEGFAPLGALRRTDIRAYRGKEPGISRVSLKGFRGIRLKSLDDFFERIWTWEQSKNDKRIYSSDYL